MGLLMGLLVNDHHEVTETWIHSLETKDLH